ncbi:MAG: transposase [Desulfobacterales bacterium]|nr:MAG: transposase [Desulfobacterales bacterium]
MTIRIELTNEQWHRIEPIILSVKQRKDPRGRPAHDPREVLNRILWRLRTCAPWKELPLRYPPDQTCHRRFQQWVKFGVFRRIAQEPAQVCANAAESIFVRPSQTEPLCRQEKGALLSARRRKPPGSSLHFSYYYPTLSRMKTPLFYDIQVTRLKMDWAINW